MKYIVLILSLMLATTGFAEMRYYLVDNEYLYQTRDDQNKLIGWGVDQPEAIKAYPYYKLSFAPDGSQCIIQSESDISEAKEITLEKAQETTDKWTEKYEKIEEKQEDDTFILVDAKPLKIKDFDDEKIKKKTADFYTRRIK